jgi:outer membrane protein OmpA-like peptidoglycan-associated protein
MGWNIAHNCGIFEAAIATSSPPRRPAPAPAMERFAIEVLNAGGKPVSDLTVTFDSAGSREGASTNARGIAHFIGPAGAPTSVSITSPKQLRNILDGHAPAAPVDPPASAVIQALAGPLSPVSLKPGISTKLVITREVRRVRLVGMFFDTDKCFLRPSAMAGIRGIKEKYDEHPKSNLLIVGHTDTSGKDDHNLKLSLERANAVAAFLTDDVDAWATHFQDDEDRVSTTWATKEIQLMLSALPEGETPYLSSDVVDGIDGPETTAAVRRFQEVKGLKVDGIAGPVTRKALTGDYMALDGTSLPERIEITTHGCGESFPVDQTGDNVHDDDNRRVEMFFFDGRIAPPPQGKTSKNGSKEYPQWVGCVTESTDFQSVDAGVSKFYSARIRLLSPLGELMPEAPYEFSWGGEIRRGTADSKGWIVETNLTLPGRVHLRWGPKGVQPSEDLPDPLFLETTLNLSTPEAQAGENVDAHMENLAYAAFSSVKIGRMRFQHNFRSPEGLTGSDDDIRKTLNDWLNGQSPSTIAMSESLHVASGLQDLDYVPARET